MGFIVCVGIDIPIPIGNVHYVSAATGWTEEYGYPIIGYPRLIV